MVFLQSPQLLPRIPGRMTLLVSELCVSESHILQSTFKSLQERRHFSCDIFSFLYIYLWKCHVFSFYEKFWVLFEESLSHTQVSHSSASSAHLWVWTKSPGWWREEAVAKDPGMVEELRKECWGAQFTVERKRTWNWFGQILFHSKCF